jgi:hypothetical protein
MTTSPGQPSSSRPPTYDELTHDLDLQFRTLWDAAETRGSMSAQHALTHMLTLINVLQQRVQLLERRTSEHARSHRQHPLA